MTKSTVTTERLKQIASGNAFTCTQDDESASMAAELLAVREAQSGSNVCNTEVYEKGVSACIVDIPKHMAEAICRSLSDATGFRIDWHYFGGRVHIKALAPPAPALPGELLDAMAEVIRISDRDHEAWDRAKAAISACQPDGEKCWSCGKYFTCAQHSECDGYCPHCNAPVDLEDDEGQPSQVVPVEPTEDMVAKAWREALGKCDHETIKRMYATMLAAAPTPTKAVLDA